MKRNKIARTLGGRDKVNSNINDEFPCRDLLIECGEIKGLYGPELKCKCARLWFDIDGIDYQSLVTKNTVMFGYKPVAP